MQIPLRLGCLIALIAAFAAPRSALAWGVEGHRITGHIAGVLLTEHARNSLHRLGIDDLAEIANYMDETRAELEEKVPGSSRWHYDNRAVCSAHPRTESFCKDGNCATHQIARFEGVLTDPKAGGSDKRNAVRYLVHMIGDLHQPLHMADHDDRGGNDIYVWLPKQRDPRRLHEVWDTQIVRMVLRRRSDDRYARELLEQNRFLVTRTQLGTVEDWAEESHALAVEDAYGRLDGFSCRKMTPDCVALSRDYVDRARIVVPEQLFKAGVRIAKVLNSAL